MFKYFECRILCEVINKCIGNMKWRHSFKNGMTGFNKKSFIFWVQGKGGIAALLESCYKLSFNVFPRLGFSSIGSHIIT